MPWALPSYVFLHPLVLEFVIYLSGIKKNVHYTDNALYCLECLVIKEKGVFMNNVLLFKKKIVCIVLFLSVYFFNGFAQDTFLLYMYSQVNDYVEIKNVSAINRILINNKHSRDYGKLENYILMKAREQLVVNDLDLAMDLCYIVIDNNLDNFEAVSLYTSIERTKREKEERERIEKEKAQIESIKQAETIKKDTEKIQREYQTITNTASGQRVYLDQDVDDYFQTVTWGMGLGLASFSAIIDIPQVEGFYGISVLGNVFYRSDVIHAGIDVFAAMALSSFSDLDFLPAKAEANLNFAFPKLAKYLYYRVGVVGFLSYLGEESFLPKQFLTPTAGIALKDIGTEAFLFGLNVDYHLAHLYNAEIGPGLSAGLNFFIRFADLKKADVGLIIGLEDSFFYTSNGFQNHAKINLSIGVWNND